MSTFRETNQVRTVLKMKLANYSWYKGSSILAVSDGWGITVLVKELTNKVRKVIPPVINGLTVKIEVD